jgi:hypothetical protein
MPRINNLVRLQIQAVHTTTRINPDHIVPHIPDGFNVVLHQEKEPVITDKSDAGSCIE